ncbi:MAG: hypothetical protein ACI39U_09435 [Candidatus Cryptobacteroides sp.]
MYERDGITGEWNWIPGQAGNDGGDGNDDGTTGEKGNDIRKGWDDGIVYVIAGLTGNLRQNNRKG